jgi:hypothetical protein
MLATHLRPAVCTRTMSPFYQQVPVCAPDIVQGYAATLAHACSCLRAVCSNYANSQLSHVHSCRIGSGHQRSTNHNQSCTYPLYSLSPHTQRPAMNRIQHETSSSICQAPKARTAHNSSVHLYTIKHPVHHLSRISRPVCALPHASIQLTMHIHTQRSSN